mgnify:CR=1 FL=1
MLRTNSSSISDAAAFFFVIVALGHSGDEGNDTADAAANWAQNGGAKGEQDIALQMQLLQTTG